MYCLNPSGMICPFLCTTKISLPESVGSSPVLEGIGFYPPQTAPRPQELWGREAACSPGFHVRGSFHVLWRGFTRNGAARAISKLIRGGAQVLAEERSAAHLPHAAEKDAGLLPGKRPDVSEGTASILSYGMLAGLLGRS